MKIVYLTTESLYGEINSGSLKCSFSNFNMLRSIAEDDIYHIYLDKKEKCQTDEKKAGFERVDDRKGKLLLSFFNRRFMHLADEKKVEEIIIKYEPDIVFYEGPYWAYVIRKLKQKKINAVFVLFMHNVEKNYYKDLLNGSVVNKILYKVTCKCEQLSVVCADHIICLNERDNIQLKNEYQCNADLILPINLKDQFELERVKNDKNKHTLLFVGSLFPPNYDGIRWFIKNVMDYLEEYKLVIVGKGFEKVSGELQKENVKVIGSVDDLGNMYYSYPVLVMPIQYGSGMKVKTAEALMYGKTIIGTKEAFEGYGLEDVEGIYECETALDFQRTIKEVFSNDRYLKTQNNVREIFLNNFETNCLTNKLKEALLNWMH